MKPTHTISIRGRSGRITSTVWSLSPKRKLWSSTSQGYSRKIDPRAAAERFIAAAKAGRVAIKES